MFKFADGNVNRLVLVLRQAELDPEHLWVAIPPRHDKGGRIEAVRQAVLANDGDPDVTEAATRVIFVTTLGALHRAMGARTRLLRGTWCLQEPGQPGPDGLDDRTGDLMWGVASAVFLSELSLVRTLWVNDRGAVVSEKLTRHLGEAMRTAFGRQS